MSYVDVEAGRDEFGPISFRLIESLIYYYYSQKTDKKWVLPSPRRMLTIVLWANAVTIIHVAIATTSSIRPSIDVQLRIS